MDRKLDELLYSLMQNMTIVVSGEKLARDLDVSHSSVVRWVDKLRESGVEVRGEPFTGYRLVRVPDVLLPQLLRSRLHTEVFGRTLYHFFDVDSTNAFADRLLMHRKKAPHGTVVVAERQTAGRGRLGREWYSEREAGLYLTLILRPFRPSIRTVVAPMLTLAAAVAMHDAIERETGLAVDIKWPNDLLVGHKKVCGILAEMQSDPDTIRTAIIGVGVNVNHARLPASIEDHATSLRIESGRVHSRLEILVSFLEGFERLFDRFVAAGPQCVADHWTRSSSFANGRTIEIDDGVRRIRGVTRGLNPLGALRVEQEDGQTLEAYSGAVVHWE